MNDVDEDGVVGDSAESLAGFGGTALFGLPTTTESSDSVADGNADYSATLEDPVMDVVEDVSLQCKHAVSCKVAVDKC